MEDTFFISLQPSSQRKKAPAHHISVKGSGLLLLDSNSVWGDGTTISFYWVSVPFQIFNYPRGQVFAHVRLNQGMVTVRHEKKHRNSRIWLILAMPDFLARVKQKSPLRSLSADTNHHFL